MASQRTREQILAQARDTLATAERGCRDLEADDPSHRADGLRNVAVFGRAVTNVLQNLREVVPHFDAWYAPYVQQMRADPLLRFFYALRSAILKRGELGTTSATYIESLDSRQLQHLLRDQPPGARSFFVGDTLGGSGWEIQLPDGSVEKYYMDLPPEIRVTTTLFLTDAPAQHLGQPILDPTAPTLARLYITYLRNLLAAADRELPPSHSRPG